MIDTNCQHLVEDRDWYTGDGFVYGCTCGHQFELCDLVNERSEAIQEVARLRAENEGYRDLLTLLSDTLPPTQGGTLCRKALAGKEVAK